MNIKSGLFLLLSILFQATSFVFSKLAADDLVKITPFTIATNLNYILSIVCLIIQSVFWIISLKTIDLSRAYPMTALVNIFILMFSVFFFDTEVSINNLVGLLFMVAGALILGLHNMRGKQ